MELVTIEVEGTTPLLMHNPAAIQAPDDKIKVKKIPTPKEDAEAGCYRLPSGDFYCPGEWFRGCIVNAAKGKRIGKSYLTNLVRATVFAATPYIPLYEASSKTPLNTYEIDSRRAVIQRQGIVRHRPMLPKWGCSVQFEYEEDILHADNIRELMEIGGRLVGVGDFRPEKSGPFGRFRVL